MKISKKIEKIILEYISNFLNSINQDLKFYESFIEYTINNKNFVYLKIH